MPAEASTSELNETRTTRFKDRTPKIGDTIVYREWDLESRAYLERRGQITEVTIPDRIGTPVTVSATIYTPATMSGTRCVRGIVRGSEPDQWDFV